MQQHNKVEDGETPPLALGQIGAKSLAARCAAVQLTALAESWPGAARGADGQREPNGLAPGEQ
jgi:hypothetical protein